jgi:hypothetical protein
MVGNDANLDILQLVLCLVGNTEVSNILAKYPQWDHSPCRLKLTAMLQDSKEIPDSADHIKPGSWRENLKLKDVSLQTSWNCGRRIIEQECKHLTYILNKLDNIEGTDILSPFGTILVDVPLADNDINESLEVQGPDLGSKDTEFDAYGTDVENSLKRHIDVEDALAAANAKELQDLTAANPEKVQQQPKFDSKVLIKGTLTNKACTLKNFSKYCKHTRLTDCLKRVDRV